MPFTIADGVLGLEGIHELAGLNINQTTGLPRIELDRIIGLHALPEADDNREPRYGRDGEISYPSLTRGKTVSYEGTIYARTLAQLRATSLQLRGAAQAHRHTETTVHVRPDPAFGGVEHAYRARVLALDLDDEQIVGYDAMPSPYQRDFVLSLRQADARYYIGGAELSANGGSNVQQTVTNPGNAPADPRFVIAPGADGFTLHRIAPSPARLTFADLDDLTGGENWQISFAARTLTRLPDGADFTHKLVFVDSDWWDAGVAGLEPGANVVTVEGIGWAVYFQPANW